MSKPDPKAAQLDEHGLVVQKYTSMVLVLVPERDFAEETLRYARSSLYNVHVGTWSVSTRTEQMLKGRLQDEFLPDGPLAGASMDAYSGLIVVGGEGALELAREADALRLVREAAKAGKMIGAWGEALAVLVEAGVVKGKRVTGAASLKSAALARGARYTGTQVERDGTLVTGFDDASGMRFGKALAQIVGIH
jgi:protease I